jgi:cytochrome b involved in lipid metabolism
LPTPSGLKTFTRAEVALHNKENDCWTYVDGKVYDLSKWLPEHPGGGFLVLVMCGVDGATALRDHHKSDQDNALATYYIGDLR